MFLSLTRNSAPFVATAAACALLAATLLPARPAAACGCFSPPVPDSIEGYAVNQLAEQIIFEVVDEDTVTAHVMISYAGDPASFAWLVPVPSVPALDISETMAFGIIDQATAPDARANVNNRCPDSNWMCRFHPQPDCNSVSLGSAGGDFAAEAANGGDGGGNASPVTVLQQRQVGSYDTVVFSAEDAGETVGWLQTNGFIVNDSMTPYMQPYLDGGMLFLAAKLVPGAGVDAIAPLEMTYEHAGPIIPLRLTAVAAEPHLAVTSYIFADESYVPVGHPLAQVNASRITRDFTGRTNYPMVLSRTVDEAGGDAFVAEYAGSPPNYFQDDTGCCEDGWDWCGVESDGQCQCPGQDFDQSDCAQIDGLLEASALLDEIASRHTTLTRLTTRISPEEMTFDPVFEPVSASSRTAPSELPNGRLTLNGSITTLENCRDDVIDPVALTEIESRQLCATTYCGPGTCVVTAAGAACQCDAGNVAREFTDLDGLPSVTCVPDVGTVDFGLGLDEPLPDACASITLEGGDCLDIGGFPTSVCADGTAGAYDAAVGTPVCSTIIQSTETPGAEDFSDPIADLDVCAAAHPICGTDGWLVPNEYISIQGLTCPENEPEESLKFPGDPPTCGPFGCAGAPNAPASQTTWPWLLLALGLLALPILRRRV